MLLLIEDGYSGTVILGEDREEILGRYLELLQTPKEEIRKHDGYAPGCYAEGNILGGMYGREKWVDPQGKQCGPTQTSCLVNVKAQGPEPESYYCRPGPDSTKDWAGFLNLHIEPSYTREKLQELIKEGRIRIREIKSGTVMFSYLDG